MSSIHQIPSFLFFLLLLATASPCLACLKDCQNGRCVDNKCQCSSGYFGSDCSIYVTRIYHRISRPGQLINDKIYSYFPILEAPAPLVMVFEKPEEIEAQILVLFQDVNDYELPEDLSEAMVFPQGESTMTNEVSKVKLQEYLGKKRILVLMYAKERSNELKVQVTYKIDGVLKNNTAIFTMICLIVGPILLTILTILYLIFRKKRCQNRRTRRNLANLCQPNNINHEEIEKFFPSAAFSSFTNNLNQKICSICIEEFEADSQCKKLYCQHIYHGNCIASWLEKGRVCPECRKPMTVEAIKEHMLKTIESTSPTEGDENSAINYVPLQEVQEVEITVE